MVCFFRKTTTNMNEYYPETSQTYQVLKMTDNLKSKYPFTIGDVASLLADDKHDNAQWRSLIARTYARIPCVTVETKAVPGITNYDLWQVEHPPGDICLDSCPYFTAKHLRTACVRRIRAGLPVKPT